MTYSKLREKIAALWRNRITSSSSADGLASSQFAAEHKFASSGIRKSSRIFDEDGIIQYLINNLAIQNKTFVEFGVEIFEESNTRFLLMNDNWQGMVLDACEADIRYIQQDKIYWQYDLQAKCTWITRENINSLLMASGFGEDLGLLSVDIDGNDYWIWEAIESVRPLIVVVEYNSLLGLQPVGVTLQGRLQQEFRALF